jgi:ATP-binding cassette subfamily B protein
MAKPLETSANTQNEAAPAAPGLFSLLRPYAWTIALLVLLTVLGNALNLLVPQLIKHAIDTYTLGSFDLVRLVVEFSIVAAFIFIFTYGQNIVQVYASERVARDVRNRVSAKISVQPYEYIDRVGPGKLLTNLTSDVDAIKTFVSQAIAALISS